MNQRRLGKLFGASVLAVAMSSAFAAGDMIENKAANEPSATGTPSAQTQPMTGKQKATAIGATTGAVAGAVVGGPVGAVVGAGVGGYVGHQGTDANGQVQTDSTTDSRTTGAAAPAGSDSVRSAQTALNDRGYSAGTVDGMMGPNTQDALRRFQNDQGIAPTGSLDDATRQALGMH